MDHPEIISQKLKSGFLNSSTLSYGSFIAAMRLIQLRHSAAFSSNPAARLRTKTTPTAKNVATCFIIGENLPIPNVGG